MEVCASGRVYSREEILELSSTTVRGVIEIDMFNVRAFGSEYALATYRAVKSDVEKPDTGITWRSSL
jgi:hypothetical protein